MRPGAGEAKGRRSGATGCWRSGAAAKRGMSGAVKRSSGSGAGNPGADEAWSGMSEPNIGEIWSGAAGRHRRSAARQTLVRAPCERSLSLARASASVFCENFGQEWM